MRGRETVGVDVVLGRGAGDKFEHIVGDEVSVFKI